MKTIKKIGLLMSLFALVFTFSSYGSQKTESFDNVESYWSNFDFEACYSSATLGANVKSELKKIEEFINQNTDFTLEELNNIVSKVDQNATTYSLNYDYETSLPTDQSLLNSDEVTVFNSNPVWGLVVLVQADYANRQEEASFGSRTWATNGDAFRHSLWNALGARGTSVSFMESFATAHETGSSTYDPNSLDTQMDLRNNATGRSLLGTMNLPSNPPNAMVIPVLITDNIAQAVQNGQMVRFVSGGIQYSYLMPTNSSTIN